jgi:hypothetical protein
VKRRYSDESGYILILAIFVVMGLLALTMLAIDLGNLYIWRVRLERAAKAGVSAGLGYRTLKGWQAIYGGDKPTYSGETDLDIPASSVGLRQLKSQMQRTFEETIKATNYSSEFSYTVTAANYDLKADRATISVELKVPTLLIGRLEVFGIPMQCTSTTTEGKPACIIKAEGTASLNPANIVLALDTSGSMECEVETDPSNPPLPNCGCRSDPVNPCGSNGRRRIISELKKAVIDFSKYFNPVRDRIAIIPFNLGASRSFSFMDDASPAKPRSFGGTETAYNSFMATIGDENANNGLVPFGNTNPCDAFIMAADEIRALRADPTIDARSVRPQVVFFTDGAPNAMRGTFINEDGSRLTNAKPSSAAPNDWYQYSIEWDDGSLYRAPGPLFHASYPLFNKGIDTDGYPVAPVPPTPPSTGTPVPTPEATPTPSPTPARCGEPWYERPDFQFVGSLNAAEPTPAPSRAPGCLTNLDFNIPRASGYGARNVPFKATDNSLHFTDHLPYYCTIEAADHIRRSLKGTVFAVGLGKTPPACFQNDPLQDSDNSFLRKDNFLSRVAFDPIKTVSGLATSSCTYYSRTNFHMPDGGSLGSNTVTINSCPEHSLNGKSFRVGYSPPGTTDSQAGPPRTPADFDPGTEGEYVGIDDAQRLKLAFARIAKQILLRLNN